MYFIKAKIFICLFISIIIINNRLSSQCITEVTTNYLAAVSVDANDNWIVFGGIGYIVVYSTDDPQYSPTVLQPSDNDLSRFGHSVSVSGNRIIVGAYNDRTCGDDSGAAYIYDYNGFFWDETKIIASDCNEDFQFGKSVAVDGDYVLVGSPGETNTVSQGQKGAAYLYKYDGTNWNETKIKPDDYAVGSRFGSSVSMDNKRFVIGAKHDNWPNIKGAAYFYEISGTTISNSQKVTPPGIYRSDFGYSVSMSGDYAIIGSPSERLASSSNDQLIGAAHIFTYANGRWFEIQKLTAPDDRVETNFGYSVDVSGQDFIVGCWTWDTVYRYTKSDDNWIPSEYRNPNVYAYEYGISVAIHNGEGYTHSRDFFHIIETTEMDTFIYTNGVLEEFNGSKPLHLLSNQNIIIKPSCK